MEGMPAERARTLGSYVHLGRRQRGLAPSASGLCLSPACGKEVGSGLRFCPAHEDLLERVRAELDGDDANGGSRERFERFSTRGMRTEQPAEEEADE